MCAYVCALKTFSSLSSSILGSLRSQIRQIPPRLGPVVPAPFANVSDAKCYYYPPQQLLPTM